MAAPPLGRSAQWLMRCAFALQVVSPAPASCSGKENIPPTTTSKPEPTQTQRQKAAIDYERRRLKVSELPGLPFSLKRTMVKSDARRLREAVEEDREAKRARMSTLGLRGGSAPSAEASSMSSAPMTTPELVRAASRLPWTFIKHRPPAVTPAEFDCVLYEAHHLAERGQPQGRADILERIHQVREAKQVALASPTVIQPLSPTWLRVNLAKAKERGVEPRAKKASDLSIKRAKAKSPHLTRLFFDMLKRVYADAALREQMRDSTPEPMMMGNFDEIGLSHKGSWPIAITVAQKNGRDCQINKKLYRLSTGERNEFWATLFLFTKADGTCPAPPVIVHQAAKRTAAHTMYLPSDWCVLTSPSGYMTRDLMPIAIAHIMQYLPRIGNYCYWFFFDGHNSHFSSKALWWLLHGGDAPTSTTGLVPPTRNTPEEERQFPTQAKEWLLAEYEANAARALGAPATSAAAPATSAAAPATSAAAPATSAAAPATSAAAPAALFPRLSKPSWLLQPYFPTHSSAMAAPPVCGG